jgi:hypothetical protein
MPGCALRAGEYPPPERAPPARSWQATSCAERYVKNLSRIGLAAFVVAALSIRPSHADPIAPRWPQPGGPGTDISITYSYSNILDGTLLQLRPPEIRAATEEALSVWARYAPIHFIEVPDAGPPPSDVSYAPHGAPQIRIGHHAMSDIAHAFFPTGVDGLGGDIHLDPGIPWTIGTGHWNLLEAMTHELGHSLGLAHDESAVAIMNPSYPQRRFGELGTAFLLPPDIEALQRLYGRGRGSVHPLDPLPEPATLALLATGLTFVAAVRRRRP